MTSPDLVLPCISHFSPQLSGVVEVVEPSSVVMVTPPPSPSKATGSPSPSSSSSSTVTFTLVEGIGEALIFLLYILWVLLSTCAVFLFNSSKVAVTMATPTLHKWIKLAFVSDKTEGGKKGDAGMEGERKGSGLTTKLGKDSGIIGNKGGRGTGEGTESGYFEDRDIGTIFERCDGEEIISGAASARGGGSGCYGDGSSANINVITSVEEQSIDGDWIQTKFDEENGSCEDLLDVNRNFRTGARSRRKLFGVTGGEDDDREAVDEEVVSRSDSGIEMMEPDKPTECQPTIFGTLAKDKPKQDGSPKVRKLSSFFFSELRLNIFFLFHLHSPSTFSRSPLFAFPRAAFLYRCFLTVVSLPPYYPFFSLLIISSSLPSSHNLCSRTVCLEP
ncbi:uncharacterized protein LOC115921591 [Strongylocentrotus purpuratus]|uniref:Uncharacterized protein n=1 Tax=Strongylocentrotus purpuratus TaxID=7668 RepID=A0A7M7NE49_STRPU|nr:uncharacterized protein LOC115921591 [Strongylocentrotus purpuratus]